MRRSTRVERVEGMVEREEKGKGRWVHPQNHSGRKGNQISGSELRYSIEPYAGFLSLSPFPAGRGV